MKKNIFLSYKC